MKVKGIIESDVDTFKVGDVIEVKLADGVKVQAMAVQQEEDGMIFCLADCLPGEHPMNSTSTNSVRHPYSHWSASDVNTAVITSIDEARNLLNDGIILVNQYYTLF